ncbi:MAG: biotin--[acetyl-CoA-carboxylase] ligase, partial [Planctomycetota bacterium]
MNSFSVETANRVIALLYDSGDRALGLDELSSAVGEGGAELEAALRALEARGHRFERLPTRGVRLVRPTVIDAYLVERDLPVEHIGRHVICFDRVDSTNDVAFDSARHEAGDAVVVTAECQRAGRGRFGRRWISPVGSGVLASVLIQADVSLPQEELTVAAGLAVAEGIEQAADVQAALAWPNDVLVGPAKVAGVLVEVRGGRTVVGFGINVDAAPPDEQAGRRVTCLSAEAGRPLERIEICRAVLARLDWWVVHLAGGSTDELHRRW